MAAQQPPCTHSLTCMRSRLSAQSHRPSRLVVYRKIVVVCLVCLFSLHVMPPLPTTTTAPQPHCTHSPTCMLSRLSAQSSSSSVVLSCPSASLIVRCVCLVYRQVVIAICQNTLAAVEWQLRGSNPLSVSETSRASFCRCHVIVCQQKMSHMFTPAAMWQLRGSNPLGA